MNDNEMMNEIEKFIEPEGNSNKQKFRKRLKESIPFLQSLGVGLNDIPSENQYAKLKAHLESLTIQTGRQKGKQYNATTINDWMSATRKFYNRNTKNTKEGKQQMAIPLIETDQKENIHADNSIVSTETKQTEQTDQAEAPSPVKGKKKPGRPKSTNRTFKFTLYITSELMEKINLLAGWDKITATELINKALEDYCDNSRADDMNFLYNIERQKQEYRREKAQTGQ